MFKTISKGPFDVIGISLRADNTDPAVGEKIGEHWQRFFSDGTPGRIPGRADEAFIAVYTDYEGDETKPYSLVVGCRVAAGGTVPDGMVGVHVPAQTYAMTTARGAMPGAVVEAWQAIWNADLQRAFTADFEVYDHRAADPSNAEVDIYTAVVGQ